MKKYALGTHVDLCYKRALSRVQEGYTQMTLDLKILLKMNIDHEKYYVYKYF